MNTDNEVLIVAIHSTYVENGVFDWPVLWILLYDRDYIVIRHAMEGDRKSLVYYGNIDSEPHILHGILRKPVFARYTMEFFMTLFFAINTWRKNRSKLIFLGIDPLNGLAGSVLKICKITDRFIYHTPDYSDRRFDNKLLNWIYNKCDFISSKCCDYNTCHSELVIKEKQRRYPKIRSFEKKLIHLPNYPVGSTISNIGITKTSHLSFVYTGYVGEQIDFFTLFDFIEELNQDSKTTLEIIGGGKTVDMITDYISSNNLNDSVKYHGFLSDKEAIFDIISHCHFGIAVYNGVENYDKYRDSTKAREYIALETIPVISSNVISTAQDIQTNKAGVILERMHDLWNHIEDFKNGDKVEEWRSNCRKMYQSNKDVYKDFVDLMKNDR